MKTRLGIHLAATCLFVASAAAQTLDVVHRFQEDGGAYGRLIQAADGTFYGTTSWGGTNGVGTVFKLDGSDSVTTLHSFGYLEGAYPKAALLEGADGNFYGTASAGGANNLGTIFKMDPTGDVTLVHSFGGPDGANPWAPLIQTADGNFYGTARAGGVNGFGSVFKMDSEGNVATLHSFANTDGAHPYAALLGAADGYFYGTTAGSLFGNVCVSFCGTVFKMDATGNVTTIHTFQAPSGASPRGALVQDGDGNLYGTTPSHRRYLTGPPVTVYGNIFKIDPSGNFTLLHTFTASEGSGSPSGLILASAGSLYGTSTGGPGYVFRASPFEILHTLATQEGSNPYAGLLQAADDDIYATTLLGGAGGVGTVFKMDSSNVVTALDSFPTEGLYPQASLIQATDGAFYGTTQRGGASGVGTVFKTDAAGSVATLHSFGTADGAYPVATLLQAADGDFYGTTPNGGTGDIGIVFKMDSAGNVTTLHSFNQTDGATATGALIQGADGKFYGTTSGGGTANDGTAFKMDLSGNVTTLHSFVNSDGASPSGALIQAADGKFFGTTAGGGTSGYGTVFKMDSAGNITTLHSFDGTDGYFPYGALITAADGNFYGTTQGFGTGNYGTVFKITPSGTFSVLHTFSASEGSGSQGSLILASGGNLYGTTRGDSEGNNGVIFKMDFAGNLTILHRFHGAEGAYSYSGLVIAADGTFWGTTPAGGFASGAGAIYRLILGPASLDVTGVSPASGPSSGGTPVSIAGTGFEAGARVMIGDAPANAPSVESSSAVSALAPSLSPGTLNDVTVINVNASFGTASKLWFADFLDVPQEDIFHDYVETILRKGITAGLGDGEYGRDNPATRAQMAVFLLKAEHGSSYAPPACTGAFPDVPCPSLFADWIEQLAAEGVTAGCGGGLYCPDNSVTRRQMAVFLLKAKESSSYTPPPATGIFGDVPEGDTFAPWIEELYDRGITGGCQASPLLYCPNNQSTRGQMAVFLVKTFGLPN